MFGWFWFFARVFGLGVVFCVLFESACEVLKFLVAFSCFSCFRFV